MRIVAIGLRGIPNVQGGIETHAEQLYPRIAKQGHEVIVIGRERFVKSQKEYSFEGCKVIPISHFRSEFLETPFHTLHSIIKAKKLKADLVHIHAIGPALFVPFAKMLGLKVVMTHHGMDYKRDKWGCIAKLTLRIGEWCAARFSNAVISISSEITKNIRALSPKQAIHQIPNGVIIPDFLDQEAPCAEFKALGLENQKYVFSLGRFVPEKAFHTLIEAWKNLPQGTCRLVIAGSADHESEYSRKIHQLAANSGVILPGFIKGRLLRDLFRYSACFVIPSTHEGLPIALLEAMSFNLPVIASDIEPHKEMELPEDCYFKLGSVIQLETKILNLLQQKSRPNFREILKTKYDWDAIALQTEKVYKNVMR